MTSRSCNILVMTHFKSKGIDFPLRPTYIYIKTFISFQVETGVLEEELIFSRSRNREVVRRIEIQRRRAGVRSRGFSSVMMSTYVAVSQPQGLLAEVPRRGHGLAAPTWRNVKAVNFDCRAWWRPYTVNA